MSIRRRETHLALDRGCPHAAALRLSDPEMRRYTHALGNGGANLPTAELARRLRWTPGRLRRVMQDWERSDAADMRRARRWWPGRGRRPTGR